MKVTKALYVALICALLASCESKNEHMEKLIPSDVAGVICLNMPNIVEKSGIKQGDDLKVPETLKTILKNNEDSWICKLVKNVPNVGIEIKEKAYIYFPTKDFKYVMLLAVTDEEKARTLVSHKTGSKFTSDSGVDYAVSGNDIWAVADGILLNAELRSADDAVKAADLAAAILDYEGKSVIEVEDAKLISSQDKEVMAYFNAKSIEETLKSNPIVSTWVKEYPILHLLLDNDMRSISFDMAFNKDKGTFNVNLNMDENCQFSTLLDAVLEKPSNTFLSTIPNTMEVIMSLSVNGSRIVKLPQVREMIKKVNGMPFLGSLHIDSIVGAISGPIAFCAAEDPYFDGDYNYVFAAETSKPLYVVDMISRFASSIGQDPEIYDGEYIYSYNNKQVKVGINNNVVYIKMLNYEQTEGYANEIESMNNFFSSSNLGVYAQLTNKTINSSLSLGLTSKNKMSGEFKANNNGNALLQFIKMLCLIEPVNEYDYDMSESISDDAMVGEFHAF